MAKWTILFDGGQIYKDGVCYSDLDLSWLPSDILAVQSASGQTADLEKGDRTTQKRTSAEQGVDVNTLSWWSNVGDTWQDADDAANSEE